MKPTDKALEEVLGEISESEDRGERGMLTVFVGNKWDNYMQVIAEKPATANYTCYTSGCKFRQ